MTGIEFMKNLPSPPKVIFTTAYDKYAIQGFELEVLDYLLKPISFERFMKAANKAYDHFKVNKAAAGAESDHLFVKADNKLEKIRFDEILFIEALENYIGIYTAGKKVITHSTMKALQEKLPGQRFIQPHKSYIVAIDKINSIEGNVLHIQQYQVPISKYLKEEVMERIVNNALLKK
jgi:DNA-binding LytR/AlgR family response regulator